MTILSRLEGQRIAKRWRDRANKWAARAEWIAPEPTEDTMKDN